MSRLLLPYWRVLVAGWRRQSTYRLAALGGLTANTTFGLLKVALLFAAVDAAGGSLAGYDTAGMSTYIWISQGLLGSVNLMGRTEIAQRIKDGSVAVDFVRPLDVHGAEVVADIGRSLFSLIPRGIPSILIGALVVGMAAPPSLAAYPLGAVSIVLGIAVSAATVYLAGATAFWLVDNRGVEILYMVVSGFLAGLFVPITLFPDWLYAVAVATPFPAMMMYPVDVLSGRVDTLGALGLIAAQVGWLAATWLAGDLLTRAGRVKLEVQGG